MPRVKLFWVFAVALGLFLGITPLLFEQIGGDILFQYTMIRCYAEQFWQGDFYPSWCFAANDGLGAPAFSIYFPFAFFITALFYPLTWMGLDIYQLYAVMLAIASALTVVTAYLWLKEMVTPERALMGALLFLFVPYRFEAMYFRSAFAEPWGMVFVPLVFLYARRLAQGKNAVVGYGVSLALLALTHIPLTAITGLFSTLYLVGMADNRWAVVRKLLVSVLLALALAAFYLVPSAYYKQFTASEKVFSGTISWANTYASMATQLSHGQVLIFFTIVVSVILLGVISAYMVWASRRLTDRFLSREIKVMALIFSLSAVLLFPVSAPLYEWTRPLSAIVFPWRMQMMFVVCFVYFAAIFMQWISSEKQKKNWRTDMLILMCFMWLLAALNVAVQNEETASLTETEMRLTPIIAFEYRSIWTDKDLITFEALERRAEKGNPPRVQFVQGHGVAEVKAWSWRGIELDVKNSAPVTLRLDHHYFPFWQAIGDKEQIKFYPDPHSGLMELEVPKGETTIHIRRDRFAPSSMLLLATMISAGSWLLLSISWLRERKKNRNEE